MKKLMIAILMLIVSIVVGIVVFAKLGFIDLSAQVLAVLEKTPTTKSYVELYRQGLQYQEGLLNVDEVLADGRAEIDLEKSELAAREAELTEQERRLEAVAKDLERKAAELSKEREKFELSQAELTNRDRMAKVYAGMEPEAAAKILLSLDAAESADLLKRMSDKDIMEILPVLPPDQAAFLGRTIAGE